MDRFLRAEMLIGQLAQETLKTKTVAVFGLGGVGSFAVEALARCGVNLFLCDNDVVDITNINRQLFALQSTVGQKKTEVAKNRVLDINSNCNVVVANVFFGQDTAVDFDFTKFDYVIDAIDTVTSKLLLVELCKEHDVPLISCMSTGNKLEQNFEVADIFSTENCPLCKVMRHELKKREIDSLKVVYSKETPHKPKFDIDSQKRQTPASISFVPPVAGFLLAGECIRDLLTQL